MLWTMGIFLILVSFYFFMSAYAIGIKGKIEKLHPYHYCNVRNKNAYCKMIGLGMLILGIAMDIPSIMLIVTKSFNISIFVLGLLLGFAIMIFAQMKYNRE